MALHSDLELDTTNHDLVVNKDLVFIEDTADAVTQRLRVKLKFFKGEWFLNTDFGVPYYHSIFVKGVEKVKVDELFKAEIINTEGVLSVETFDSTFNTATREYSMTFSCTVSTGEIITLEI